jgi:hypothetical protein
MDALPSSSKVNLNLNAKLYDLSAVKTSVEDFSEFFSATMSEDDGYISLELTFEEECDILVVREFFNYILGVMQDNR